MANFSKFLWLAWIQSFLPILSKPPIEMIFCLIIYSDVFVLLWNNAWETELYIFF